MASFAVATLVIFAAPVEGAELMEQAGNWGLHLGYARTKDADSGNFLIGGHVELQPAPIFGLQGAVSYRDSEEIQLSSLSDEDDLVIRTLPVTLTGRLYLPMGGDSFSPFALAGAGWYHIMYDFSERFEALGVEDESETSFGWHMGAGARMAVSPRVSLFGEARWVFLDPERDFGDDVQENIQDVEFDSTFLSGGLNFHF
jgi:opacity protein-like surface antigen